MTPRSGLQPQFGQALRGLRLEAQISQEELAGRADLDTTYISLLERGQRQPTLAVVAALAGVLGKRPYELVKAAEEIGLRAGLVSEAEG